VVFTFSLLLLFTYGFFSVLLSLRIMIVTKVPLSLSYLHSCHFV